MTFSNDRGCTYIDVNLNRCRWGIFIRSPPPNIDLSRLRTGYFLKKADQFRFDCICFKRAKGRQHPKHHCKRQ